ncbi:MAG: lipopolysaccharide biosynthesis protein [Muribaculaceae bacterium]|nr:lipopolysaccharide biosynthesis protein [Muribaculaceae bacterium]
MAEARLKQKAVSSVLWRILEQGGKQLIYFGVSVVLARLIMPDQFGMVAMLTVFINLANVFVDSGFSSALIRKTARTQADCSTVYWFNILVSVFCYFLLFLCAPLIARFYDMPQLSAILRVSAFSVVIGSVAGVHRTLLQAEMNFKAMTKFNLLSLVISGAAGITFALLDFEVWALVIQNLTMMTVATVCVWMKVKWRPSAIISRQSFKEFFGFGSKLLASSLLDTLYGNIYSIVIGKVYKAADLAYYNRSTSLTTMTSSLPTSILQSVTYPVLCKIQDDESALKEGYRRTLRLSAFVVFPLCLGAGAVAFPLINVLYTDRWIFSATLLSIIVFSAMWYPIHAINLNYLIVKGRSDLFFRLEIIKKVQAVIMLCITVPIGLEAMCYGGIVTSLLALVYNTYYTGRYLHMGILAQLRDLVPCLLLSLAMFVVARAVAHFMGMDIISLVCSVAAGAVVYLGGAWMFRFPELKELRTLRK